MNTYISLLRGINVGGHKSLPMEALKKICASLHFQSVSTYIQSGNIVFRSDLQDTQEISRLISEQISQIFGFDVYVVTLSYAEFKHVISANPYASNIQIDIKNLYVTILSDFPDKEKAETFIASNSESSEFSIIGKALYLYCPNGYSTTKITNELVERKLKLNATTRNWNTITELYKLALQKKE